MDFLGDAYWKLFVWYNTWWGQLAALTIIVATVWLALRVSGRRRGRHIK